MAVAMETVQREAIVPHTLTDRRADQALAELWPEFSRSRLQQWIRDGSITVDGRGIRPRDPLSEGTRVRLDAELEPAGADMPERLPLRIVHEDDALIVLDKSAGMVVHPGAGNRAGTLVNALLHHAPQLAGLPRAGIVHRLDKDTSGLLVVARTLAAYTHLVDAMQKHAIVRDYLAIVNGVPSAGGTVDAPVGRHPKDRKRMAVRDSGRRAVTHYRVIERFRAHACLSVRLETGRTHQIRVHMAHLNHPLVGDPVYGRRRTPPKAGAELAGALAAFERQALHAHRLSFPHPDGGEVHFEAEVPADITALLEALRADGPA